MSPEVARPEGGISVERLTDKHFNKSLGYYMKCSGCCERSIACNECEEFEALVDRLGAIEEILGDDYDMDRLRELVEADRDGRVKILPECVGKNCGTCANFNRIPGSRHGNCEVRKHPANRYGRENKEIEFQPVQSRIACKQYVSKKIAMKGDQHEKEV